MMIRYFVFFVCYVPIFMQALPRVEILNIQYTSIFFYLLLLIFIVYSSKKYDFMVLSKWTTIIAIYSIVVVASVSWSKYYSYDLVRLKFFFYSLFIPFSIATIALKLFKDKDNVVVYTRYLCTASLIFSLISIYQLIVGDASYEGYRAAGALGNANGSAIWLVLMIPPIIYGTEKKSIPGLYGYIVLGFSIGGVICTMSRKGIVTMFLSFFIYYLLGKQFKKLIISGTIFFSLALTVAGYTILSQRFDEKRLLSQFKGRAEMVYAGWDMFKDNPVKGLGFKGFYENILKYRPRYTTKKLVAHNNYITALANYGLLGFIPLISIFLYPLFISSKIVLKRKHYGQEEDIRDMATICMSCLIPFMISSYFAGSLFYDYSIMPLLFTQCSFVIAMHLSAKRGKNAEEFY